MQQEVLGALYLFLAVNLLVFTVRGCLAMGRYVRVVATWVCWAQTRMFALCMKPLLGLALSYAIHRWWIAPSSPSFKTFPT